MKKMGNQVYQGAFSRRYSGFTAASKTATNDPKPTKTLKVTWNGGMGKVNGNGNYTIDSVKTPANSGVASANAGDSITLTATADNGFHFVKWIGYPVEGMVSNTVTIKMTNDFSVSAVFEADKPKETETDPTETPNVTLTATGNSLVDKVVPFVKKWWWAILIVAYVVYKNMKGAKQ